jgi:hypothetical protein
VPDFFDVLNLSRPQARPPLRKLRAGAHFAPPAPVLLAFALWPLYDTYNDAVRMERGQEPQQS